MWDTPVGYVMCCTFGNGTVLHEQVAQNKENRVLNKVIKQNRKTKSNGAFRSSRMRGPIAAQHFGKLESQLRSCENLKTFVYTNTSVHKQPLYEFSLISDFQNTCSSNLPANFRLQDLQNWRIYFLQRNNPVLAESRTPVCSTSVD